MFVGVDPELSRPCAVLRGTHIVSRWSHGGSICWCLGNPVYYKQIWVILNGIALVNRETPQIGYKPITDRLLGQTSNTPLLTCLKAINFLRFPAVVAAQGGRGHFWRAAKRIMAKLQKHRATRERRAEWEAKRVRRFYPSYDLLHRDCSGKSQQVASHADVLRGPSRLPPWRSKRTSACEASRQAHSWQFCSVKELTQMVSWVFPWSTPLALA